MSSRLDVIHRHDCPMCDEMLEALGALGREHALPAVHVLDVDSDPVLTRRFGFDVPVLLLDGTVVCRHRLDRDELLRLLRPGPRESGPRE